MNADRSQQDVTIYAFTSKEPEPDARCAVDLEAYRTDGLAEPAVWMEDLGEGPGAGEWNTEMADRVLADNGYRRIDEWGDTDSFCSWEATVVEDVIAIPEAFESAFIALANDSNGDPDPLDLGVSDDRLCLYLSNSWPGYSPYLVLSPQAGGVVVAIRATIASNDGKEWPTKTRATAATVTVDLTDPHDAARKAHECWISTL